MMNRKLINPKNWFRSIRDRNLDLQERLFRLLVVIGLCGLAVTNINAIIIGENIHNIIPLAIAFFVFSGIAYLSFRFHKVQLGAAIIGAIIIYFVLPFNFLTTGGIYGGAPIYILFGMVYVCLAVEGKVKYIFLSSGFIISVVCYYIAYCNPAMVSQHTQDMAYVDSIMSLLIVGVWVCGMILFQNAVFQSENELVKRQKQEIEELNRAQSSFFSGMSHEIRTPINTIIGLNELILREDVSDKVAVNAINMQDAGKTLLALINDFLDMSKIESGKMDIVPVAYNVGDMLSDIVDTIWISAKDKGLAFHVDVDQAVPAQLIGDEVRIKQILLNVLNNAVKYTQAGSVTLSIQSKEDWTGYAQISYSIIDTGMGIKQENIPYLFNAFKRVDDENNRHIEGTGLGLPIVKQLLELMGGDISVNSVYTKGSTFIITLPQRKVGNEKIGSFDPGTRHAYSAREHYKQSFEAPNARILIVDDNEINLMVAENLLRDTKMQIDTAISGEECLQMTLQHRYDAILMDHLMPGMDGIECLHEVRRQTGSNNQNTPIVILTANAGSENQALYKREGFDGYLTKPVSTVQLEEELLKHLSRELVSMTNVDDFVGVVENPIVAYKTKMLVMVSADSVCDLPRNLVEKYRISILPYRVVTDSGEFLDGVEAETEGVLSYMNKLGRNVKSEPPAVSDYEEFFAEQLTKAQYIIHITVAGNASEGYANALEASKTFDNVIVVDSGHLTCGMGLIVMRAAEYAADGMSADAIVREIERMKKRTRTSFIVESTEYLSRAGKIAPKIHELCKTLMLHPVLVLKNNRMKVGAIEIGARDQSRRKYITSALRTTGAIDTRTLFIAHAGLSREELEDIEALVRRKVTFREVFYQQASSAISANCGPGTVALCFMMK